MNVKQSNDRQILEHFVVANDDLNRLEGLLDQFNIFEAIGGVRQELRHSEFLAFLLNPQQSHGLRDIFLKDLLHRVLLAAGTELPINLIDLDVWSLDDTVVLREWRNIDILAANETNKVVVLIENKIGSSEHSEQLARYYSIAQEHYPGWKIIALYLTPEGSPPSDETFLAVSYDTVASLVEAGIERRTTAMGNGVKLLLSHYVDMLRRHVVSDSEIDRLCVQIYRKHQRALDLIFERRPDIQSKIREFAEQLIQEAPDIVFDRATKASIAFTTERLDRHTPRRNEDGWSRVGRMLLFQFTNKPDKLQLILEIGSGPAEVRQKLFSIANSNKPVFSPRAKLSANFSRIWSRTLLQRKDYEDTSAEALFPKIRAGWERFLKNDMPKLIDVICREMPENGS